MHAHTIRQSEPVTDHKYDKVSRWQPVSSQGEPTIASEIQVKCTRMKILFLYELLTMEALWLQCTYDRKSGNGCSNMRKYRTASNRLYAFNIGRSR